MLVLATNQQSEEKKLTPVDLTNLSPNLYNFKNHVSYLRLGLFLIRTQNNKAAEKFIAKSSQIFPNSPIVNQLLGQPVFKLFFW